MKLFTVILAFSLICVAAAAPQNFLFIENDMDEGDNNDASAIDKNPTRRPMTPLRPMHMPPQFQNLGFSLPPPPPPPLQFVEPDQEMQLDLGNTRFIMNLLDKLRPAFPWLQSTTTTPAP